MSITPHGSPWDQETYKRIERKGGCHYQATCADYVQLERKIEAHEMRYGDRCDVYGDQTFQGMRITDTVVVLNGGLYMSTGIEKDEPEAPPNERVHSSGKVDPKRVMFAHDELIGPHPSELDPNRGNEHIDAHVATFIEPIAPANERVHNDGRVWSEDDDRLRISCGMDVEQWREWNLGGGWSEPRPISEPGQQLGAYFAEQAAYHRKRARIWAGTCAACIVLLAVVLLAPSEWIYWLFEALE